MKLIKRAVAVVATALGVIAVAALPAQAYTSDPFAKLCTSAYGANGPYLEGDWHRASDGTSVNLANARIWNNSGYRWDITSSHWEDLTTGQVQRGITGYLPFNGTIGPWNPTNWYKTGHAIRWLVNGYRDDNPNDILSACLVLP